MKKFLFTIGILIILFNSCKKDSKQTSTGIITAVDQRECMCCSGWFILIDNNTYRFKQIPENSTINLDGVVFPCEVYIEWNRDTEQCLGDEIIVSEIRKK